jgi:putative acyl-CoA dehydrogenase
MPDSTPFPETHEVSNQPPALQDYNLYETNLALQEAVGRGGAGWAHDELSACGAELGGAEWIKRGDDANRNPPAFLPFDRFGGRLDAFDFHPAWHQCMAWLKGHGVDTGRGPRRGPVRMSGVLPSSSSSRKSSPGAFARRR